MKQLGSPWTDFHEICFLSIFKKSEEKIQVPWRLYKNNGYFTWRPTFYTQLLWYLATFFVEWEMLQTKFIENIKTHIFSLIFFFFENRAFYEIMWKNMVGSDRPQMTTWLVRIGYWITKATNTHTHTHTHTLGILIAFPWQKMVLECASMLCFKVHFLSCLSMLSL